MRFPWGWPQLPAWAVVALAGQWQQLSGCRQVSCSCLMSLFGAPRELLLASHPCCVCKGWLNAPAKPCSTYQRGDSSPTGAEGTSSEVNQASLKKHLKHLKIPNIRCFFFFILVIGSAGWPQVLQGAQPRQEPARAALEGSVLPPRLWGVHRTPP